MRRQLKVYNSFGELILHLELVDGDPQPLQILDGTPHMRAAVRSLFGQDFDLAVPLKNQPVHLFARWGTPEYIDALAQYWSANFGWRTKILSTVTTLESISARALHQHDYVGETLDSTPSRISSRIVFVGVSQTPIEARIEAPVFTATHPVTIRGSLEDRKPHVTIHPFEGNPVSSRGLGFAHVLSASQVLGVISLTENDPSRPLPYESVMSMVQ